MFVDARVSGRQLARGRGDRLKRSSSPEGRGQRERMRDRNREWTNRLYNGRWCIYQVRRDGFILWDSGVVARSRTPLPKPKSAPAPSKHPCKPTVGLVPISGMECIQCLLSSSSRIFLGRGKISATCIGRLASKTVSKRWENNGGRIWGRRRVTLES